MRLMPLIAVLLLVACAHTQDRERQRLAWHRCAEQHSQAHAWLTVCH